MDKLKDFLYQNKYEILLFGLIQHLFIGILFFDLSGTLKFVWVSNIIVLGFATIGIFIQKGKRKNQIRNILLFLVLLITLGIPFNNENLFFLITVNVLYILFFIFIFWEVLKFLVSPSYINKDVISAAACGYFLLIEISVFIMQTHFYQNPKSFNGISTSTPYASFTDLVYFCCITFSSIGFGDITPNSQQTKLFTSLLGIIGQFYSVVLVGILISKFSSHEKK
ncbi:two pore domain potassium channel family protein [Flavobacterium aquariorum]|uniref:Two pore domain potassium channel family protein n=1 Tax=Flavobacterium aquariorum TaxID=2217670 RepID=A0A2W7U214_9FLAO|nr:potassium channel family protein [Flavobacterium aquariorum]PZX95200.1 two pore domain potassium channel family protein [Flavobacterium aquariorum]